VSQEGELQRHVDGCVRFRMIRFRAVVRCHAVVAISLLALSGAGAQGTDSVPRELALALLRVPGDGLRLLVGTTPERFPAAVTPRDSKLLGAAQRELSTTVVFISRQSPQDAMIAWENQLLSAGWIRPQGYAPLQRNGLLSSATPLSVPVLCSGGVYASLNASLRYDGGSTLLVQYSDSTVQSLCTRTSLHASDAQVVTVQDTMPLPALAPPANVTVVQYSNRAAVDQWEQHARVSGSLSAEVILRHYGSQLVKAGFAPSALAAVEGTATQSFRRKLDSGFDIFASIIVLSNPFDTTSMTVQLTVYRRR
jgi:hypothetical protein